MESVLRDMQLAFRLMLKNRLASAASVITLALGIGANTAIFSTVDALVLHPFDFPAQNQLVDLSETFNSEKYESRSVAPADYLDWKEESTSFEGLAAYNFWDASLTGDGEPEQVLGAQVSADLFATLGVRAALGRTILDEEQQPGKEHIVVISDVLWRTRYGADTSVLGRSILINGNPFTVVGIMPKSFKFPQPVQFWAPLPLTNEFIKERKQQYLSVVGRLKPDVSLNEANAEIKSLAARLEQEHPATNKNRTAKIERLRDVASGNFTAVFLWTLMGAVVFVLMIAAVNVANIQLARASGRTKEVALRAALGAPRGRVLRQLLTENVVLSLMGGAAGILTAVFFLDFIRSSIPPDIVRYIAGWDQLAINRRALLFTFIVAVITGLLFGLAPVYQASKTDLNEALKEGGRNLNTGGRHRLRSLLVIGEVALALSLLVGAGLMVRGFGRLAEPEGKGFDSDDVLTMQVWLSENRYPNPERMTEFYKRAIERIGSLPGVTSAFALQNIPDGGNWSTRDVLIEGKPAPAPGEDQSTSFQTVAPGFFQAMRIPILDGREFSMSDDLGRQRVAIISSQFAHRYFAGENPMGKRIRVATNSLEWATIIGVVGDVQRFMFDQQPVPAMYLCLYQSPLRSMHIAVRTSVDTQSLGAAARAAIRSVDPDLPVNNIKTVNQSIMEQRSGVRLGASLMLIFGVMALALAAVGVYAVMSYTVQQRNHEIGVRMALGASQRDVLKMVFGNALTLSAIGLGIGLPAAYALSRVMASALWFMVTVDAATFISFSAVLMSVALLATYIPARRASKVDPMIALRCE